MFDLHDLFPVDLYCRRAGQRGDRHGIAHRGDGPAWPADAAAGCSGAAGASSLLTNLWQLLAGPALAQIVRRLWLMMTGIIIGTLAGSSLLIGLNPRWSALALGAALIVYAGYALCSPVFQVSGRVEKWLSPLMGGLTGVITGATGVFVIPAVPSATGAGLSSRRAGAGPGVVVHPFHSGVGGRPRPARWLA